MKRIMAVLTASIFFTALFAQKMTEVRKEDLPKNIETYIKNNFKGATIFKAVKLDDKGTITYDVAIDLQSGKQILVFDKAGKYLKKGDELPGSMNKNTGKNNMKSANAPQQATTQKDPDSSNPKDQKK